MTAEMKKCKVSQAKFPPFVFVPAPKWPEAYNKVAELMAECREDEVCADYAFHITNNIDAPWFENTCMFEWVRRGMLRSTSVGDVITVNDVPYLCDQTGWSKIT